MKKKVFSLMMALVLAFMGVARAENLTVSDGTATDQYIPLFGWYADSYFKTESVYPSDMLATMAGGDITSVKFYASQTNVDWGNARFRVFLDEVNGTVPTGFSGPGTIVYEGALSIVGNEMTVTFTTPYHYNGGNLLLGVYCYVKGSYVQSTWFGTVVSGAALYGYSYSSLSDVTSATQRNFLPKTTFTYTGGGGTPGGGGSSDPEIGLHVRYDNGEEGRELVIDDLYLGEYPAGAWMEPFHFEMYNDDTQALTVSVLDFTPNTDALSMVEGIELPFTVAGNSAEYIDLAIQVQAPADAEAGDYEYQFVAIYEGSRLAKIWPLSFTIYTPEIPDVVEKAYDLGTIADGYTYTGVPSEITPTVLHNDYTLPFPEIPEGNDAVYKFTVEGDMIINAYVDETNADGKVALYTEDFNGEAGPMATNNYTGLNLNGGSRSDVTFDFEDGILGWTTIDADGDGYDWMLHAPDPVYIEDLGHEGSDYYVHSQSYDNEAGVALTPDNYLVSPSKAEYTAISFWACAQDPSYAAEHFGVAVSTAGNTSASDFTTVQEWTMTARSAGNAGNYASRSREGSRGTWYEYTVDLSAYAGQEIWVAIRHFNCTDMFILNVDDITIVEGAGGGGTSPLANVSAGPVIEALPIQAGTYYLVASSTDADYTVYINAADMPCPAIDADGFAFAQYPADDQDSIQPASVTLTWTNPEYATGWRLVFGSTYYPEAGHPQTILFPEDGSFSTEMANSYTVTNLWNNTNYFWHVEFNNGACADGVSSPIWGFTTTFNAPQNLVATPDQLIEGETTTLTWNAIVDRTYRTYRVYKDGVMIHETQPTPNPNVEANLSWTVPASELTYNMTGYTFNVTAVYDEGESPFSNDAVVKVTGYSAEPGIYGYVYEQDSVTPIGGVTVTVTGTDEFGNAHTYSATTDNNGYYTIHPVLAGEYATALATCAGYQDAEPYTKVPPFTMPYQGTWGEMNFIMQEGFYPSPLVCAETVQVGDDELVKVWWQIPNGTGSGSGTGGGGGTGTGNLPITQGFEDGLGDWTIVNGATGSMFSTGVTTQLTPHSGNALFMFYFTTNPPQYLISPMLTGTENGVDVSFYHSARSAIWQETFQVGYSTTTNDVDAFVFGPEITSTPLVYSEYTNSFPAGTKYVAVKCTSNDAFGLWIDDISISASGRGTTADRALHHYRIYRTNCYYDGPYYEGDPGGTVVLASAWVPDTAYFDVSWPDAAPGVYKWGVGVVYEGNQADNPNNPRGESQINWAAPMNNMDIASAEVTPYASNEPVMAGRAMWDLLGSFEAAEQAHYGVATDGTNLYTSNWGYSGATHNFYKYDMQGNMIEGFEIAGCGTLRGMTYDGQYFYGVANSSTVYCVDLANHTLVSQFNSAYGAMRCITYDPVRDGFWVVGNWSGDLTLIDRTGAIVQVGPTPQSASDVAYYEDEDNVEHVLVYSQPGGSGNALVFDYNIATNTLGAAPIFDVYNNLPGVDGGSSGGAFVGEYNGKTAFFANIQQSPNLIGIFELKEGTVTPTPTPTPGVNNCDNLLALPRESCTAWSNECSPCIDKDMEIEVSVNVLLNSADSPEGTTVGFTNLNAIEQAMHPQDMLTLDDSGYHLFDSFRRGTYAIEVRHEGYYTIHDTVNIGFDPNDTRELRYVMTEILYPVRNLYISRTGWAMWERESGWEDGEPTRHFNYYKVMCTSIDGEPIFNKNTEHPFCQVETSELVEGNYYICKVACMFTTGLSAWTEQVFQYEPCDNWGPVDVVTFNPTNNGNHIAWTFDHGHNQWIDLDSVAPAKGGNVANYKGQAVYRQYADNGIMLNFIGIDNVDFRSFLLYNITKNDNFVLVPENEHGQFIVSPREEKGDFAAQFAEFYNSTEADFNLLSKSDILENANLWKSGVNPTYYISIMMDVFANNSRVENDRCINSMPFCTTDLIEFETANTDQTAEQLEGQNFEDGCIGMSYNPSWYHLRIQTAGPFIIHMEGHDPNNPSTTRDVDFCIWGPFTDPTEPCVDQLTLDKIIDCSYSASYEEDIYLGYPGNQHDHGFGDHGTISDHVPQVGEYYIMMLTNYSRQPCVMSFTKTEGEGETDCDIVAPTNIIGFLITQDGEYLDFVPADARDYTHVGEFGDHEYCVRPIYPGPAILPDTNYFWCMGCPVCVTTNGGGGGGEEICEPVSNLTGYYLNYNGQEGLVLDWEEPEGATTVRIYADDEYVGDAPASSHPIFLGFDGEVPEHTFVLGVVAVHPDCESEMVTVNVQYDDVNENDGQLAIFPNPTNGNVKIMANAMRHITVVSVLGQVVYDADVNTDEMDLNMGQWNAGVYVVRIVTETGIHTQRVTVVR